MSQNLRDKGDKLEARVANALRMRVTYNSGALQDDADLKDEDFIVECKVKATSNGVSIPHALIKKVEKQAVKWRRYWAIVVQNAEGKAFITMPLDHFADVYDRSEN